MEGVVGGDWAATPHDVGVEDRPGHRLGAGTFAHTREVLELREGRLVTRPKGCGPMSGWSSRRLQPWSWTG
jgi:hypothetical protein